MELFYLCTVRCLFLYCLWLWVGAILVQVCWFLGWFCCLGCFLVAVWLLGEGFCSQMYVVAMLVLLVVVVGVVKVVLEFGR